MHPFLSSFIQKQADPFRGSGVDINHSRRYAQTESFTALDKGRYYKQITVNETAFKCLVLGQQWLCTLHTALQCFDVQYFSRSMSRRSPSYTLYGRVSLLPPRC